MFSNHEKIFASPDNLDIKVWRYMDFPKFYWLLKNKSLYFPRADKFNDKFEGSIPIACKKHYEKPLREKYEKFVREHKDTKDIDWYIKESEKVFSNILEMNSHVNKQMFISCWHMNDTESYSMWKNYSSGHDSICIQSTWRKLSEFSRISSGLGFLPSRMYISTVRYIDYQNDAIEINDLFWPYVHKRSIFKEEREVRMIIHEYNSREKKEGVSRTININNFNLIEKIYVNPYAENYFYKLIKDLVRDYLKNSQIEVVYSSFLEEPWR